jgi:origin recognition complex subunit 6
LKTTQDLPPIQPRPPIPPKLYQRLYNYLDRILPAASTPGRATFGRSPSSKSASDPPSVARKLPSRVTPTKERALAPFRTATTPGSKPNTPSNLRFVDTLGKSKGADVSFPPWVRPMLRFLCTELDNPRLTPLMMAGIDAIVLPHGRRSEDEWVNSNLGWVLGALYMYIWKRVYMPDGIDETLYVATRRDVVEALARARTAVVFKGSTEEGVWAGWHATAAKDVDGALKWIRQHGWLEGDWAAGIDDFVAMMGREGLAEEVENGNGKGKGKGRGAGKVGGGVGDEDGDEADDSIRVRRPDTMFQDRYDFLSERKLRAYSEWKSDILERIAALEREPDEVGDAMETDP